MNSAEKDPFASHLARWRSQEPEMEFAEPFVPAHLRPRFRAWGTLLGELERSLLAPSEPNLAAQRLAWWHGELGATQAQHPVARALADAGMAPGLAAPVAGAATLLAQDDDAPADTAAAVARFADYADAVLRAEQSLFGGEPGPDAGSAVATGLLVRWVTRLGEFQQLREYLPLQLLARHPGAGSGSAAEQSAVAVDLARALAAPVLATGRLPLYRALRWRYERHRMARLAAGTLALPGQPVPGPLRATILAWTTVRQTL